MRKAGVLSILFVVVLLAVAVIAQAQQPKKSPRIGLLVPGSLATYSPRIDAFRQGLRDLGYVDGRTYLSNTVTRKESWITFRSLWLT